MRDPDGYYIEFCNCETLEKYLHGKMAEEAKKWNFTATKSVLTVGKKLRMIANDSKMLVRTMSKELENVKVKPATTVFNIHATSSHCSTDCVIPGKHGRFGLQRKASES